MFEASNEIFKHYGKPAWTAEEFREKFYLPFPKFYEEYLPQFVLAELDDQYHSSFKILQNGIALLPHALDFLDYLRKRGLATFLLSSIHRDHFAAQGGHVGRRSQGRVYLENGVVGGERVFGQGQVMGGRLGGHIRPGRLGQAQQIVDG